MILFILLSILLYITTTLLAYKFLKIAYSEKGIWYGLDADLDDILWTFVPISNICPAIDYLIGGCYKCKKAKTKKNWINKFFKIN